MAQDGTAFTPRATTRISAGIVLNNTFQIDSWIGSGGMGEIYRGHFVQTGDPVAIKLIRSEMAENETVLSLFRKEASILHKLQHEAIVRYFVFTDDPRIRRPYLVMEFVDGPSLAEVIRAGPLPYDSVRLLQRRLAAGLQAAHELGIVHRDLSPDNVILPGGEVKKAKIIDFGIARAANIGDTIIGSGFAGKYKYVSPEQLGLYGSEATPKSDIYSMGLVLTEALTGQATDMGATQVEMVERRREVPDLSKIDTRIRPLIKRMLQPRPEDRPASMAEVAEWGGEGPAAASALGSRFATAPAEPARRRKSFSGRLTFVVGLGAVIAAVLAWNYGLDRPPIGSATTDEGDAGGFSPPATGQATRPTNPPTEVKPPAKPDTGIPTPTPPEPPRPKTRQQQIADFVASYNGGGCYLAKLISITDNSARIEGFGTSPAPFETFLRAFKDAFQFEPDIALRPVDEAQCPTVDYLAQTQASVTTSPNAIMLDSDVLGKGDRLSGWVEVAKGRHLTLLLVSSLGMVSRLADFENDGTGSRRFSYDIGGVDANAPEKFLLVAVASDQPFETLSERGVPGKAFFPLALERARKANDKVSAAAKYFERRG